MRKIGLSFFLLCILCFVIVGAAGVEKAHAQSQKSAIPFSCSYTSVGSSTYSLPGGYIYGKTWFCNNSTGTDSVHGQAVMLCNSTCYNWALDVYLWYWNGSDWYKAASYANHYYSTGTVWAPNTPGYCDPAGAGTLHTEIQLWDTGFNKRVDFNTSSGYANFNFC